MSNVPEADERRAYIEDIISLLDPGIASRENAERNLASLDLDSLAQMNSRLRDAWERASAMVQALDELMRKETHSEKQELSTASHAAEDSLVDVLFKLRDERTQKSVQQSEISYASQVARLLRRIGSQGNNEDFLLCHRKYVLLYSWVENLWRDPIYDPRLEFFRLLALSQRRLKNDVLRTDSGFWSELLWKVPSTLPLSYAEVALFGIVGSVRRDSDLSVASVIDAFVLWARMNPLTDPWLDFLASRLVADIANQMPGYPVKITGAGNVESIKAAQYPYLKTLISLIKNKPTETMSTAARARLHDHRPKLRDRDVEDVIRGFSTSTFEVSRQAVESLHERCIQEAISRRDGKLLRRLLCRLGNGLLSSVEFANDPRVHELACELALDCIRWDSQNVDGWYLWVKALKTRGALWATEIVMWERVRRFPTSCPLRGQLGGFLEQQGKREEAKAVLIEYLQRFPKNGVGYRMLANLLVSSFGDLTAAVAVIDEGIEKGAIRYERRGLIKSLKRLKSQYERSGPPEAKPDMKDHPDIERVLRRLPLADMAFLNGECVRLEFLLSHPELKQSDSARKELESLARDEDFPFASFLLLKNGIVPGGRIDDKGSSRAFASHLSLRSAYASLLEELAKPDHVNWSKLYQMTRRGEGLWLIRVAENLLEDQPPFGEPIDVGAWVKAGSRGEYEISDVLRERLRALVDIEKSEDKIAMRLKEQPRAVSSALSDAICWAYDSAI